MEWLFLLINKLANFGIGLLFFDTLPFLENQKAEFLIVLIVLSSIGLMLMLKFNNIRHFPVAIKILLQTNYTKQVFKNSISSHKAFWSAISGSVGIGSIAGMCAAVYFGGPGTIFWIMVCGFLVMPMRYAEVYFGHKLRITKDGIITECGPFAYVNYVLRGIKSRSFLLKCFAFLFFIASIGAIALQANPVFNVLVGVDAKNSAKIAINLMLSLFVLYAITGGLKRISAIASKLAVCMSALYVVATVAIIISHYHAIGNTVMLILHNAFNPSAMYGGIVTVMFLAFKRCIVSMEVGFGTTSLLHGRSDRISSHHEACLGMIAPFFGSLVFCALNGLMLVVSGAFTHGHGDIETIRFAFVNLHPLMNYILIIIVAMFGFSTIITWFFYGISAIKEITNRKVIIKLLPYFYTALVFVTALTNFTNLLAFIDFCTLLIVIPNIIVLFILVKKHRQIPES